MERKKTHRIRLSVLAIAVCVVAVGAFFAMHEANATPFTIQDFGGSVGLGTADLKTTVINIIKWILGILALTAVVFIIYGGVIWLTSAGNPEKIQKAKKIILNAVIGMVIVLISWAIVIFVTKFILGTTGGGGGIIPPCPPGRPDCTPPPPVGLEIRSITTDCENADVGDYRHGVFICSGINITFNHVLNGETVKDAVKPADPSKPKLIIEQCSDGPPGPGGRPLGTETCIPATVYPDSALDGHPGDPDDSQLFVDGASSSFSTDIRKGAAWTSRLDNTGKSVTFVHVPTFYDKNTWFRVTIPKAIKDVKDNEISACRESVTKDIDGCIEDTVAGTFTWTMQTGDRVDSESPVVTSSYPDSRYLTKPAFRPDRNVPRTPIINLHYNKAIFPLSSSNVVIELFDAAAPPDPATGAGGTINGTVSSGDYTVFPGDDGRSANIQMKQHATCDAAKKCTAGSRVGKSCAVDTDCPDYRMLDKFTWYRVTVKDVIDLCVNPQKPEPFVWVFETNDVVPGVAQVYPPNGYDKSCPSTPMFIQYTVSMYDTSTSSCKVLPAGGGGGYVLFPYDLQPPVASKDLKVDDDCTDGCTTPQNRCKVYSFKRPPTGDPLQPNKTYKVGVQNSYVINDAGLTLSFGTSAAFWGGNYNGDATKAWSFDTKDPDKCADPPVITSIDPPQGTDGQCVTIHGYNFDGNKDGALRDGTGSAGDVDDVLYGATVMPDDKLGKWSDTQVGAMMPDDGSGAAGFTPLTIPMKVRSMYPDPIGTLESATPYNWTKIPGDPADGPCLMSLDPDTGIVGSQFSAGGKRFDPASTTKKVHFDALLLSYTAWNDNRINGLLVPNVPVGISYDVSVENDKGSSNAMQFTVAPTPPGQPVVIDRWPACSTSCIGADIGAEFNLDVDSATLTTTSVKFLRCTDDEPCRAFGGELPIVVIPDAPIATTKVRITPAAVLTAGSWYRVVLLNSIKGKTSPDDGILGGLNFRYPVGAGDNNAYSWTFKTAAVGAEGCKLDRVEVVPKTHTMHVKDEKKLYTAESYTEPNACSASGQRITTSSTWLWDSPDGTAPPLAPGSQFFDYLPAATAWTKTVQAKQQTVPDTVSVVATATKAGVSKNGTGTLMIDFDYCTDDASCQKDGCTGSTCDKVTHRCTPFVKSMSPIHGDIGTWVGIDGCHFGKYVQGYCFGGTKDGAACETVNDCYVVGDPMGPSLCLGGSSVNYDSARGLWPDKAMCGPIDWTETHITSEVPNRLGTFGSVAGFAPFKPVVVRWDGKGSAAPVDYTWDSVKMPGICKVEPARGSTGATVNLIGQNFGAAQGTSKVVFYDNKPVSVYKSWSDAKLTVVAPVDIANNIAASYEFPVGLGIFWGANEVIANVVSTSSEWSNVKNFEVIPPGCVACLADAECGLGKSCGYGGCCAKTPTIVSKKPDDGDTDVCRNAVVNVIFDMSMDPRTVTASTAHLIKNAAAGSVEVSAVKVAYDEKTKSMTITPSALLDRLMNYTVVLGELASPLQNGDFESITAGKPDVWMPSGSGVSMSADVPLGVPGANSVQVDASGVATQSYVVQTAGAESKLKRTFRVTGWVKYETTDPAYSGMPSDGGGLITRNAPDIGSIGFDLRSNARIETNPNGGLFGYNSPGQGVWHYVDLTVTNDKEGSVEYSRAPSILCFANVGAKVLCDNITVTEVMPSLIRSKEGAALLSTQWSFTTADTDGPCNVSKVRVVPSTWTFNTADPAKPESQKEFKMYAYSDKDALLTQTAGVLEWRWNWSYTGVPSSTITWVPPSPIPPPGADTATVTALNLKGKSRLFGYVMKSGACTGGPTPGAFCLSSPTCGAGGTCKTPIGQTKTVSGSATITTNVCDWPWSYDGATYGYTDNNACTIVHGAAVCQDYHFNVGYCLDGKFSTCNKTTKLCDGGSRKGQWCATYDKWCPELPFLSAAAITQYETAAPTSKPVLLKEYLFKEFNQSTGLFNSDTKDAIGLRIYDNVEGLSALEWYKKYAPKPRSTVPLTVDGYDAVRDGTTVYIGASNLAGGTFTSKIFLLSYNVGADQKIVNIYNQFLESWFFNNNPELTATCNTDIPEEQWEPLKSCAQRDLRRIAGLSDVKQYLLSYYAANKSYPKLDSGSYLANLSFSVWPSWQTTLGGDVKQSLPVDPRNAIANCPADYSKDGACWSEAKKSFLCTNTLSSPSYAFGYTSKTCYGGADDGKACSTALDCPGGMCSAGSGKYCSVSGGPCLIDGDCTGGVGDTCSVIRARARLYANLEYTGPGSWINGAPDQSTLCPAGSTCSCFNFHYDVP